MPLDRILPFCGPGDLTADIRIESGTVSVTNFDQWADAPVAWANGIPPCCVDGRRLFSFIKLIGDKHISADLKGGVLTLKAGGAAIALPTLPAEVFSGLKHAPEKPNIHFTSADLAGIIGACDQNSGRWELRGIFACNGRIEATNAQRAARRKAHATLEKGIIIPWVFAQFLVRNGGEEIACSATDRMVTWHGEDGTAASSKLINCRFPDIERIWPKDAKNITTFIRDDLTAAMSAMAIAGGPFRMVCKGTTALFTAGKGKALVHYETTFSGGGIEVLFGQKHFSGMLLSHKEHSEISMKFASDEGPFLFCDDELLAGVRY